MIKYILDGCDGTGKSTKANLLAKECKCDILHLTSWSNKTRDAHVKRLMNFKDVIFDRSFYVTELNDNRGAGGFGSTGK